MPPHTDTKPKLSMGEAMVWAAAYVADLRERRAAASDWRVGAPPLGHELELAQGAAEAAWAAVKTLQDIAAPLVEGWGENHELVLMHDAMVRRGSLA